MFLFIIFLLIVVGMLVWGSAKKKELKQQVRQAIALSEGDGYSFFHGHSGIAINTKTKHIAVAEKWKVKAYPYSDVRSWEASKVHAGQTRMTAFGGATGALENVGNHHLAKLKADAMSGFFVRVADIENTEWHIQMVSEKEQARWMEIFRQHINEA
ncbi:DUF4755 domain-containing protein [Burkholderia sp. JKS000303]|uniref:DUF4755 domain-containing protein n=1 Tax=Burkholderia sp. JKS000303 TaxID=1938747 RepID=UPI000BF8CA67|nr:DUF4755 domain-containing protein [Burkholderia sp. JKS000303]PFH19037.1 uncharacterized protein DUF4755 [Burkholderia sp. JKS000303]